jgi:hypothetical protein
MACPKTQHISMTSHVATIFCNHLARLLQKVIACQKNQHHIMLLLSFVSSCKVVTKDSSIPEKPTHHMLLLSFVIILQRLCSPNEDFGMSKNMWVRPFVRAFHTPSYSILSRSDEKHAYLVISTDTSYYHLVISTDTSYYHLVISSQDNILLRMHEALLIIVRPTSDSKSCNESITFITHTGFCKDFTSPRVTCN